MVPNVDLNKIKFISCEYVPSYLFSHVVFTKITNECPLGYSARQATILYVYPLARYVIHLHTYPNKIQKKTNSLCLHPPQHLKVEGIVSHVLIQPSITK